MIQKLFFPALLLFLSGSLPLFASDITENREAVYRIQAIISPHAGFYNRKTLILDDLANPSTQLEAAQFLVKEVELDKDYRAAQALLELEKINPAVSTYLTKRPKIRQRMTNALNLQREKNKEYLAIEKSIAQALVLIDASPPDHKIQQASLWLTKPLPVDRIKCCAVELLSNRTLDNGNDIEKILKVLSSTDFGRQQVEKARSKISKT